MTPHVAVLTLYPLKGASGIEVPSLELDAVGPVGDRRWMLVDPDGVFLSQRSTPEMALLQARIESEPGSAPSVRMSHPVAGEGPLFELADGEPEGAERPVRIWDDSVTAVAPDAEADDWFSDALQRECHLVRLPDSERRPTDPKWAPDGRVAFADGYPLLVASEASLAALNRRLETPLSMNRFRPNLTVAGVAEAHGEDRWRRLRIGAVEFAGVRACARCAVTTVDQSTGQRGDEPLRTLADYRKWDGKVWFGQNLVHLATGVIRVGDSIEILESGDPRY